MDYPTRVRKVPLQPTLPSTIMGYHLSHKTSLLAGSHSVIIDGMVLLHTNPLARLHAMTDYANMIVNKFIAPYY